MSDVDNNGIENGFGSTAVTETGIVPADSVRAREGGLVWMSYLWFVLAGAFAPSTMVLSSVFLGYGACVLTVLRGARTASVALFISFVAAAVASIPYGSEAIPSAIVMLAAAYAVGCGLGSGRLTSSGICLVCVLAALSLLGIESSLATWAGTNLNELALAQIDKTLDALAAGTTGISEGLAMARSIMTVLWPTSYMLTAVTAVIAAAIGVRIARTGLKGLAPRTLTLTTFDTPFWVAGLLLAAIIGFAVSQSIPSGNVLLMVAANLAMATRFAFGTAGVAVAAWFMRKRGMRIVPTLLVCAVLVFFDLQFFVMTIVGLIDFWANFRRLPRVVARLSVSA